MQAAAAASAPKVPAGHPRVYVTPAEVGALRAKIASPEFRTAWEQIQGAQDDPKHGYFYSAFVYLVNGDKEAGRRAIEGALAGAKASKDARTYGMAFHLAGIVYDWCYGLLSAGEKQQFIAEFERIAGLEPPGYPAKPDAPGVVGHSQEGWLLTGQLPAGVAIYDEQKTMYDAAVRLFQNVYVPVRNFHYRGHGHHQGDSYFSRFMYDQTASWLFRRMGAGDVLSREQQFVPYQFLYKLRPDGQQMRRGDTFDDSGRSDARKIEDSKRFCAQLTGYYYEDPYLLWACDSDLFNDLGAFEKVFALLFRKPGLRGRPLPELPLTKYFAEPIGDMVARTGWTLGKDSPDAVIEMRVGQYFFGNHQRKDFGTFQIYYKGALAITSGSYRGYGNDHWRYYYHPTVSHNGLLIYDPNEAGRVADGGQRTPNEGRDHPPDLETMRTRGYQMGEVVAHEFGPDKARPEYSYIAGDITKAYSEKVSQVTRSMAALATGNSTYPAALVVFDRIRAARPEFRKTWLLHSIQEPEISGRSSTIVRNEAGYGGKLFTETLLPAQVDIRKIGGPGKEFWVEPMGRNFPLARPALPPAEPGAWRIEVSPAVPAADDQFLHVMTVADAATARPPAVRKIEARDMAGAAVLDRAVLFSATGAPVTATRMEVKERARYLVCDLQAGEWTVSGPRSGAARRYTATPEGKCVYFDAAPGTYELKLQRTQ